MNNKNQMKKINKSKKVRSKGFYITLWSLFICALFVGVGYALTTITNNGVTNSGSNLNGSGIYVDTNTKLTKSSVSVGFGNDSDFVIDRSVNASTINQIQAAADYLNRTTTFGGRFLIKAGVYNIMNGANTFLNLGPFGSLNKFIWVQGEGFGTVLVKNSTNSGLFGIGNSDSQQQDGIIISDLQVLRGNQSLRLINGQPATLNHKNIFIERILSGPGNASNTSERWLDLDADNLHINEVTLQGALRGGDGNLFFASQNVVKGNQSQIAAEVECIDVNGAFEETFIYANSLGDCYEQIIDNGNRYAHIFGNHLEVNTPTDQGGVTIASRYDTVFGNTVEDVQNSRGGIEWHEGAMFGAIMGNVLISNSTNHITGDINDTFYNPSAVGMRVDGENATIIGNVFVGFNGTNIFQGAAGQENQWLGNWFEPTAFLPEAQYGINLFGTPRQWVIQGANVNVTRNLTVDALKGSGTAYACLNASGQFYRGNATGCP